MNANLAISNGSAAQLSRGPCPRFTLRSRFALLVLAVGTGSTAVASDEAKDHTLFVGQEVAVLVDGEYRPVVAAGDRSFIVEVNRRRKEIYTNQAKAVRVARGMKLTTLSAAVNDIVASTSSDEAAALEAEAVRNSMAVTAAAEDQASFARAHEMMEEYYASLHDRFGLTQQQRADYKYAEVEAAKTFAVPAMESAVRKATELASGSNDQLQTILRAPNADQGEVDLEPEFTDGAVKLSASGMRPATPKPTEATLAKEATAPTGAPPSAIGMRPPPSRRQPILDYGNGRSDRLDLEFKVSAPEPIDNAFVVITTEYVVPGKSEAFRRVLAQKINRITSTPQKISLYETGYPPGFHINDCAISLYANAQEIATNLSANALALSREEAYQYVVAEYLASHKGQTQPPAAVLMAPRSALQQLARAREFSTPIYVSVDHDGNIVSLSLQDDREQEVGPVVRKALENFRFIPALQKGVPAGGRAKLLLADFTR